MSTATLEMNLVDLHEPFAVALRRLLVALDPHRRSNTAPERDPAELVVRGQRAETAGRHEDALLAYTQAVASAPRHYGARLSLGRLLSKLGNDRQAVVELEAAVALSPALSAGYDALFAALLKAGRPLQAAAVLARRDHCTQQRPRRR